MKFRLSLLMLCALALGPGCASPRGDFCDVSAAMYFGGDDVIDWLSVNDEPLLRSIVTHNSLVETCP